MDKPAFFHVKRTSSSSKTNWTEDARRWHFDEPGCNCSKNISWMVPFKYWIY